MDYELSNIQNAFSEIEKREKDIARARVLLKKQEKILLKKKIENQEKMNLKILEDILPEINGTLGFSLCMIDLVKYIELEIQKEDHNTFIKNLHKNLEKFRKDYKKYTLESMFDPDWQSEGKFKVILDSPKDNFSCDNFRRIYEHSINVSLKILKIHPEFMVPGGLTKGAR